METTELGRLLKQRRREKGLTQEQLEEITGLAQHYISQVERGAILKPSDEQLQKFSDGLDIPMDDIKIALGYIVVSAPAATDTSRVAMAETTTVRKMHEVDLLWTENRDILTDEDEAQIAEVIERRRRAMENQ